MCGCVLSRGWGPLVFREGGSIRPSELPTSHGIVTCKVTMNVCLKMLL